MCMYLCMHEHVCVHVCSNKIMSLHCCFPTLIIIVSVVIDGYTHNSTLTSGDSVPLGTQLILVCHVVGLPYGTPLNYAWTCPGGQCFLEAPGKYDLKVYNEHVLVINTTYTAYSGTYTCLMKSAGRQDANGSFTINVLGK